MKVVNKGQVYGTAATSVGITCPPCSGLIVGRNAQYTSPAAGTITIYRPVSKVVANAAVAADTTLVIKTDSLGKVDGAVVSTSDYILAQNPTTGAWVLSAVSSVAAVSSSTVSLVLGTAITVSASDKLFLARSADIVSITTGTETVLTLDNWFVGKGVGMPVHLVLAATGTNKIATCWDECV